MSPFELASFIRFIYSNFSFVSIQFLPIKLLNHDKGTPYRGHEQNIGKFL